MCVCVFCAWCMHTCVSLNLFLHVKHLAVCFMDEKSYIHKVSFDLI